MQHQAFAMSGLVIRPRVRLWVQPSSRQAQRVVQMMQSLLSGKRRTLAQP